MTVNTEILRTEVTPLPNGKKEVKITVKFGEHEYWAKEEAEFKDDTNVVVGNLHHVLNEEIAFTFYVARQNARQNGRIQ
jgi:hypothetical protein